MRVERERDLALEEAVAVTPQEVRAVGEALRYAEGHALYRIADLVHAGDGDTVRATLQRGRVLLGALKSRGLAVDVDRVPL